MAAGARRLPWAAPAILLVLMVSFLWPSPAGTAAPHALGPVTSLTVVGVDGLLATDLPGLGEVTSRATAQGVLAVRSEDRLTTADAGWATLRSGDRAPAAGLEGTPSRTGSSPDAIATATGCTVIVTGARTNGLSTRGTRACTLQLVDDDGLTGEGSRTTLLDQLDDRLVALAVQGTDVIVVGTGGSDPEQLSVALEIDGPAQAAALVSSSTGRAPYVQLIDVVPTVVARLGGAVPKDVTGHAWRAVTPARDTPALVDLARGAEGQRSANLLVQIPTIAVLVAGLALLLLKRYRLAGYALAAAAAFPFGQVAAQVVPWWTVGHGTDGRWVLLLLVLATGVAAAVRRATPGFLASATLVLLGADLATGAHLQVFGLLGLSPVTAGRFIGVGNLAYGILAAATLVLAHRQRTRLDASLVCALGVVLDGFPTLGADLGGTVALTLASAVLVTRGRPTVRQTVVTAVVVIGLPVAAALVDLARPANSRTHLGRFASDVLNGHGGGLVGRKISADATSLFLNPLTALVPILVVAAALLGRRLVHVQDQRLLLALVVAAVAGLLANDSGVACAAATLLLGIPLVGLSVIPGAAAIGRASVPVG